MPCAEKVAVVSTADASANVTVPGPDTTLQVVVTVAGGLGRPSSVAVPSSDAASDSATDASGPASTVGAWFCGRTIDGDGVGGLGFAVVGEELEHVGALCREGGGGVDRRCVGERHRSRT